MLGYGQIAHGRGNFGCEQSRFEPRFEVSRPIDGSIDIPVNEQVIAFILYCFSSRLNLEELLIEISENGGTSYSNAYLSGSFVSPYNGSESKIIQIDGQRVKIYIHRTSSWTFGEEIRIKATGEDGFGNSATKIVPVKWD